jgi:aspartate/methionine/tyrosine aminotransferase
MRPRSVCASPTPIAAAIWAGAGRRLLPPGAGRFLGRTTAADRWATTHLFVTSGASQALDLICTLYTQPGDTVFVEEPTYFLALRIFADHRLRVVSIDTDEAGAATSTRWRRR